MFKELEEFKAVSKELEDRLSKARSELWDKQRKHAQLKQEYNTMIEEDAKGIKQYSLGDLNKAKKRLEELEEEIEYARQREERLEAGKAERLASLIESVRQGAKTRANELNGVLTGVFDEVRGYRAKTLLSLQKSYNEAYGELSKLTDELQRAEREAGLKVNRRFLGIDIRDVFHDDKENGKIGIIPNFDEINRAANLGQVPDWVYESK